MQLSFTILLLITILNGQTFITHHVFITASDQWRTLSKASFDSLLMKHSRKMTHFLKRTVKPRVCFSTVCWAKNLSCSFWRSFYLYLNYSHSFSNLHSCNNCYAYWLYWGDRSRPLVYVTPALQGRSRQEYRDILPWQ